MTSVRTAAARVLETVESGRATLAAAIDRARAEVPDERDRGLLLELTSGTLRWRGELDAILARASGRRVDDIERPILQALRLGAYQLRHLTRVPAHAVVDEAVESVRALGRARAAGFTNAVLRSIGRGAGADAIPARPGPGASESGQIHYLATALSHPAWLVSRWLHRYGFEQTEAWCRFNNAAPTITVRPRSAERGEDVAAAVLAAEPTAARATTADAIRLPPGALGRLPAALRESIVVQDEGSQLVAHVVTASPGMCCFDVCAAPGGKTTVLWRDMNGEGLLVAADRRRARVRLLASTLRGAGVPTRVVALDAAAPLPFGAIFDRVLLDAPCSGLGTVRRDPDVKWARTEADLARLAATERAMLTEASATVRPGGRLIYATCSSEPDENEDVVQAFLASNARFALAPAAAPGSETHPFLDAHGFFRTLPFRDGLDAFFAAVLVRSSGA